MSEMKKRHNSYDHRCRYWFGDRSPARNRKGPWKSSGYKPVEERHRWFGGRTKGMNEHRCIVCVPYTEAEAAELLDCEQTAMAALSFEAGIR